MNRISELVEFVRAHDKFAVLTHVNPDGDAVGCAVSAALALQAIGKEAYAFVPGGMPLLFSSFECPVTVVGTPEEIPYAPETVLTVDISALDRMGNGKEIFEACPATCVMDHHSTNPGFGDVCVVDGEAASCAEVVKAFYDALGIAIPKAAANWLYIAACTDSGRFGFSSTRGETLDTAAAAVRAGADVDAIVCALYRTRTIGHTRLLGDVLHHMHIDAEHRIAWSVITDEMFDRNGATREDTEGIVNYLIEMAGMEVAFLVTQSGDRVKASLRSAGKINVARDVALPLGGGGHPCAAGVGLAMGIDAAVEAILGKLLAV